MAGTAEGRVSQDYDKKREDPPEYKPEKWDGDSHVPPGHGTYHNPDPTKMPPVPKKTGDPRNLTSVHTPSMEVFAKNIEALIDPCKKAQQVLKGVHAAPGDFFHGHTMRTKVSGDSGGGGCKESYLKILDDLSDGLANLAMGIRLLSKNYSTTEEANKITGKQLDEYIHDAAADFNALAGDTRS